jgi:2',3'-cyclic-nucleotide 2'-phosphodiesterase (5'-nucleotidase family)
MIKKLRAEGQPVLAVDSGDLFFDPATAAANLSQARAKAQVIMQAYKAAGIAAINVGEGDLMAGVKFLQQGIGRQLPLISANLVDRVQKKPIFTPYVIREVAGVRIAFFGLANPSVAAEVKQGKGEDVMAADPVETARRIVKELTGKADLIFLLSDLGVDGDTRVAKACPGIHFILGGHDGRYVKLPYQEGETFIVQSYQKGMYLGKLTLTMGKAGVPFQDEGRAEGIQEQLNELDGKIGTLQLAKTKNPSPDIEKAIARLKQERTRLQAQKEQARQAASRDNHFQWTLERLVSSLPEDAEVNQWIKAAGITGD